MFAFLGKDVLNTFSELIAPKASPVQELHQAIEEHQNDKVLRLVQEGVYWNSPDASRDEALPIHSACRAGNQTILDHMLEMGADVNAKDRSGNLPLHYAAKAGKMEIIKQLIGLGADVGRRNNNRQTAYDVAMSHTVRQFLLPLQLRTDPEPAAGSLAAVHNPDVIRDYSNLPPPPTFSNPGQYNLGQPVPPAGPPQGYVPYARTAAPSWTDPAVTRPIAADGFHCSVGNAELAAKYGHVKTIHNIAPPPRGSPTVPLPNDQSQSPTLYPIPSQPPPPHPSMANGISLQPSSGTGSPYAVPSYAAGPPRSRYVPYVPNAPAPQPYSPPQTTSPLVQQQAEVPAQLQTAPPANTTSFPVALQANYLNVPRPPVLQQPPPPAPSGPPLPPPAYATLPALGQVNVFRPEAASHGDENDVVELDSSVTRIA